MTETPAFQDLNAATIKILIYTHTQLDHTRITLKGVKTWLPSNPDKLYIPYKVLSQKPYSMKPPTIVRAIDSLLEHGFLKVKQQGGRVKGHPSIFALSDGFLSWVEGDVLEVRRPYLKRGFCKHG